MTNETVSALFDRMDRWRHLPNYQLERRADLFFSLYLPEALERKLGYRVGEQLVPEFPVRIGTIYPKIPINKTFKIDYLALSHDLKRAAFVELKTDSRSRRSKQDRYLEAAQKVGLTPLLEGLLEVFRASNAKRKYFCLLTLLESIGLASLPPRMKEVAAGKTLTGINEASREVVLTCPVSKIDIVYLQPSGEGADVLNFEEFAATVSDHQDPFSTRFAASLREWAKLRAGEPA